MEKHCCLRFQTTFERNFLSVFVCPPSVFNVGRLTLSPWLILLYLQLNSFHFKHHTPSLVGTHYICKVHKEKNKKKWFEDLVCELHKMINFLDAMVCSVWRQQISTKLGSCQVVVEIPLLCLIFLVLHWPLWPMNQANTRLETRVCPTLWKSLMFFMKCQCSQLRIVGGWTSWIPKYDMKIEQRIEVVGNAD